MAPARIMCRAIAPRWLLVDGKLAPLAADPRGASTTEESFEGAEVLHAKLDGLGVGGGR